ncbi:MAG: tetratricopeptide repeat protein [Planctomycetales bacterium]
MKMRWLVRGVALGAALLVCAPAAVWSHGHGGGGGGGGGHGGGGGGHFGGGGGHFGGGGSHFSGGHMGGGGMSHFSGGHTGGMSHFSGGHMGGAQHFSGSHMGGGTQHFGGGGMSHFNGGGASRAGGGGTQHFSGSHFNGSQHLNGGSSFSSRHMVSGNSGAMHHSVGTAGSHLGRGGQSFANVHGGNAGLGATHHGLGGSNNHALSHSTNHFSARHATTGLSGNQSAARFHSTHTGGGTGSMNRAGGNNAGPGNHGGSLHNSLASNVGRGGGNGAPHAGVQGMHHTGAGLGSSQGALHGGNLHAGNLHSAMHNAGTNVSHGLNNFNHNSSIRYAHNGGGTGRHLTTTGYHNAMSRVGWGVGRHYFPYGGGFGRYGYGGWGYRHYGWGGRWGYGWGRPWGGWGWGWGGRWGWGYRPWGWGWGIGFPWFGWGWGGGYGGWGYGGYGGYGYGGYGCYNGYYNYNPYCTYGYGGSGYPGYGYGYAAVGTNGLPVAGAPVATDAGTNPLVIQADPNAPKFDSVTSNAYADRGEEQFKAANYDNAVKEWRHAVVEDPKNGVLVMMLAQGLFATGKFEEAAGAIQQGMLILPEESWGVVPKNYKELYTNIGDYTTQLRALEKARKEKPDDPALRFLLGYHYGYLGFPQEAVVELKKNLSIVPEDQLADKMMKQFQAKLKKETTASVIPVPPVPVGDQK